VRQQIPCADGPVHRLGTRFWTPVLAAAAALQVANQPNDLLGMYTGISVRCLIFPLDQLARAVQMAMHSSQRGRPSSPNRTSLIEV
jgi:hypothetical protein